MELDTTKTVRELALTVPQSTQVFEQLGIDYCCGGNKSLQQACGEANLEVQRVTESLEAAAVEEQARQQWKAGAQWADAPLADLIARIKDTYHKFTRDEIARLRPLLLKVCNVHGDKHPELLRIKHDFEQLAQELTTHMMKEEMVLFPYIERMEEAVIAGEPILPGHFVTVKSPVAIMVHEHAAAGNLLRSMRSLSGEYQPPAGACTSYRTLYAALGGFEKDLHHHIHLENNILFPRAVEMERGR